MTFPAAARALSVASVLICAFTTAAVPAQAQTAVRVDRMVHGSLTARFTLAGTARVSTEVTALAQSPLYGFSLVRPVDGAYHVTLVSREIGPTLSLSMNFEHAYPEGLALGPGTYDVTLFSLSPARIRITLFGKLPALRWSAKPLSVQSFGERTTSPFWEKTMAARLRDRQGLLVYLRDEWTGAAASSRVVCRSWQKTRCAIPDVHQLADVDPTLPGGQTVVYAAAFGNLRAGDYDVTVQSLVAGTGVRRVGVLLPVP